MVNSISKTVQQIIDNDLPLQDALQRGYANYSALARMIKPKVEQALGQKVKLESLITSVKRAKATYNYRPQRENIMRIIAESAESTTHKNTATIRTRTITTTVDP